MNRTREAVAIRPMTVDDIPVVVDIDRLSFALPWPERSYRFEIGENPTSHLLVAEQSNDGYSRVVGYVGFWLLVDEAHISTLAVHPDRRGRGIGEQLLVAALERALELGAALATLEVRTSNDVAIGLYRKHGFEMVGQRPHYYRDNNEDALLMSLVDLSRWRAEVAGGT